MSNYDIIIMGSGIVGATAALLLAKNTSLKIAITDSQTISPCWQAEKHDHRVSAISLASKRIFNSIDVWQKISAKRVSPYSQMQVWDENSSGEIHFDSANIGELALGYIIEDQVMKTSLCEAFSNFSNLDFLNPLKIISLSEEDDSIKLTADDNKIFTTKLLIAADGANSWVREQIQTPLKTWDYQQTAIVATIKTEKTHENTAWQRFLATGPLAFLPLSDTHRCSIVWSAIPERANELLAQNDEDFRKSLSEAFAYKLGEITEVSQRYHFPLRMRHAKNYVQSRIALIGDAAHTIHPLAGQGVNLGLLDAACLAEVIVEAVNKKRDFSHLANLRRYERWRKSDNLAMLAAVDALKHLFMNDKKSIQTLRGMGLGVTNHLAILKNFFVNHAVGNRADLPSMACAFP